MPRKTRPDTHQKAEKKSEMLDVRLPYGLKTALVKACKQDGTTVSDTVRRLISEYVAKADASQSQPALKDITMTIAKNPRKTVGLTITAALSALLLTAQPSMADNTLFASYDKNNDGIIAADEIHLDAIYHLDSNDNNSIEPSEFKPLTEAESTTSSLKQDTQGQAQREISATYKKIDLTNPGTASVLEWGIGHTVPADMPHDEVEILTAMMLDMMKNHAEGVPHYESTDTINPKPK